MQFEVNGQDYFFNFIEEESRWYVFARSLTGVQKVPVYEDNPKSTRIGLSEDGRHKIPN